jgi:hypothetical protein
MLIKTKTKAENKAFTLLKTGTKDTRVKVILVLDDLSQ